MKKFMPTGISWFLHNFHPDIYLAHSIDEFLENKQRLAPTNRSRFNPGRCFNGMFAVQFALQMVLHRSKTEGTYVTDQRSFLPVEISNQVLSYGDPVGSFNGRVSKNLSSKDKTDIYYPVIHYFPSNDLSTLAEYHGRYFLGQELANIIPKRFHLFK